MEIKAIRITERGPVPRALKKYHRAASKSAYNSAGIEYHTVLRPLRFTRAHAIEAKYRPRAGEQFPFGSKAFWRSYVGRKLRGGPGRPGTNLPLVWTGRTRERAQMVSLQVFSTRVDARYALNQLNRIPWAQEEFRRILPRELTHLGQVFDAEYDREFNRDLDEGMRFV
jgi:hypothetical protein